MKCINYVQLCFISLLITGCVSSGLKDLKGEIVFLKRDGLYLNIYKITPNNNSPILLYHNTDPLNSNCLLPKWSNDGLNILFIAMYGSKWKKWIMDSSGNDPKPIADISDSELTTQYSMAPDIIVHGNKIYINGNDSPLYNKHCFSILEDRGPAYVSWGPDREFIIFDHCGKIFALHRKGNNLIEIAEGMEPDWKH